MGFGEGFVGHDVCLDCCLKGGGGLKDVVVLGGVGLREEKVRGFIVIFLLALVVIIRFCYYLRDDSHSLMSTQRTI